MSEILSPIEREAFENLHLWARAKNGEKVTLERLVLARKYTEEQAALYLGVDPSTLKRRRLKACGDKPRPLGGVRYLGIEIVDMYFGRYPWDATKSENTALATTG